MGRVALARFEVAKMAGIVRRQKFGLLGSPRVTEASASFCGTLNLTVTRNRVSYAHRLLQALLTILQVSSPWAP
jgi:hypothetical protein